MGRSALVSARQSLISGVSPFGDKRKCLPRSRSRDCLRAQGRQVKGTPSGSYAFVARGHDGIVWHARRDLRCCRSRPSGPGCARSARPPQTVSSTGAAGTIKARVNLAVMLTDGGEVITDAAALADQPVVAHRP